MDIDELVKTLRNGTNSYACDQRAATAIETLRVELEEARKDAERWRSFRARDGFPDLDFTHFQDMFREDADSVIDAARQQQG